MDVLFDSLKSLVYPTFHEEGPPKFVNSLIVGQDLLGLGSELNPPTRSILELITLGYRPVTSLAILAVLGESPNTALGGTQIGRELEKHFKAQEGWFTKTRYYTDRVGKLLPILSSLNLVQAVKKDPKGGRSFTGYQIHPSVVVSVKEQLRLLAAGKPISIFRSSSVPLESTTSADAGNPKNCASCEIIVASPSARYCERCAKPLTLRCQNCNSVNEAIHNYCLKCGNRIVQ